MLMSSIFSNICININKKKTKNKASLLLPDSSLLNKI